MAVRRNPRTARLNQLAQFAAARGGEARSSLGVFAAKQRSRRKARLSREQLRAVFAKQGESSAERRVRGLQLQVAERRALTELGGGVGRSYRSLPDQRPLDVGKENIVILPRTSGGRGGFDVFFAGEGGRVNRVASRVGTLESAELAAERMFGSNLSIHRNVPQGFSLDKFAESPGGEPRRKKGEVTVSMSESRAQELNPDPVNVVLEAK